MFSRLVENASWLILERVATLALAFVFTAWVVRYLGPEEYGRYSYALSLVALFASIASLGMDSVVVRDLARFPEAAGEILGTAVILRAGAGLAAWVTSALAVLPIRHDASTRHMVAIVGLSALFTGLGVFELWFQAKIAARALVTTRFGVMVLTQFARGALILATAPVTSFAAVYTAGGALTALALFALYKRSRPAGMRLKWSALWARRLLGDSWPLIFVAIGIAIYMKVDQVMLSWLASDRENGIYAPAVVLSELGYFIPTAISSSAFPIIVRTLDTMPSADSEARLQAFYDGMALVAYVIMGAVVLGAVPAVSLLYGPQYAQTANVLRIHVASLVFVSLGIARGRYLIAQNMIWFTVFATYVGAVSNVVFNLFLIPRYGAIGAAWSTLISYAAANYLSGLLHRPVWRQTAMLTLSLLLPARIVRRIAARLLALWITWRAEGRGHR